MKIPTVLPITAEQSRAARFQLGLTQAQVIESGDLPGYKLKQFETGRFVPDIPFLQRLRDFYASQGIQFANQPAPATASDQAKQPAQSDALAVAAHLPWFLRNDLSDEDSHALFDRYLSNEERVAAILGTTVRSALFGGWTEDTEAKQRELFGAMAENYLLLARLQGRVFLSSTEGEPTTHAEVLGQTFAASPVVHLLKGSTVAPQDADTGDDEETAETGDEE